MKRVLLVAMAIGVLAGQASADMTTFTLNKSQALLLDELSVTGIGTLLEVTDSLSVYENDTMLGQVGYYGFLTKASEMTIGATAEDLGLAGQSYDGFELWLANDNDDNWEVALYVEGQGTSAFTALAPQTSSTLTLDFGSLFALNETTDLGFIVRNTTKGDAFHISAVVPTPVAVLLGLLGLGTAGLKLRKYV